MTGRLEDAVKAGVTGGGSAGLVYLLGMSVSVIATVGITAGAYLVYRQIRKYREKRNYVVE